MSDATTERLAGMNQPPLTSANRPDLAALPAYVEPPPQIIKVGRRKRSSFAILVMALGAGVCGGVALNEYKQHPPTADMPFQRFTEVPAEAPAPVVTRPEDVPLPEGVQPVHLGVAPPVRNQMVASRHPGSDRSRLQPARLTRPSNGYAAGSL